MGWFTSLFSSDSGGNSRRGQAMSHTHDAFSLPTSSPTLAAQPDGDLPATPDTTSYTYPPNNSKYDYVPTKQGPLLPTHHDQLHTPNASGRPYPPLAKTWARIHSFLSREYPELGDTLNYGMLPADLAEVEMQFGFALPAVVRESYLCVDGQEPESSAGCSDGLFFGLTLLPLDDVLDEWRFWRDVDEDPSTGANPRLREVMQSIPPGWVRREYSQRGWIPLIADKAGNYVGVDINPGEQGQIGQVIVFGRDFDSKVVLHRGEGPEGWANWLASFVEDLESGDGYEVGTSGDQTSEGSEDDVGYESYFYDGANREGGGEPGSGGGLRLTGEYRGWNVMEAWADRSVRKWYELGIIAESALPQAQGEEKPQANGAGVVNSSFGAEVAIPVLAESDPTSPSAASSTTPTATTHNASTTAGKPTPLDLPTISVTKPPAPVPVDLPTPRDISSSLPSPPDSRHSSFDEDLEAGQGRGMSEQHSGLVSRPPRDHQQVPTEDVDSPTSAVPLSTAAKVPLPETSTKTDIPDLLTGTDTQQLVDTSTDDLHAPVQPPVTAPISSNGDAEPLAEEPPNTAPPAAEGESEEPEAADPDVTIRLVGGGGMAGTSAEDGVVDEPESLVDNEDTASVTSATSTNTNDNAGATVDGKEKKKHKKGGSFNALKKMTSVAMKKKASSSSVKAAAAEQNGQ